MFWEKCWHPEKNFVCTQDKKKTKPEENQTGNRNEAFASGQLDVLFPFQDFIVKS